MPAPYARRPPMQGVARALNRGAKGQAGGKFAGLSPVVRPASTDVEPVEATGDWVVVEPEADIAAKGHPYISFDPAGVYTP